MAKKRKFKKSKPKPTPSAAPSPSHSAPPPADSRPQTTAAPYLRSVLPTNWHAFLSALLIVLAAAPAIVAPYGHYAGYTPDLHIAAFVQVVAAFILLLFSLALIKRPTLQLPRSPVTLPLCLLLLWAAISIFWSLGLFNALSATLNWLGGVFAFIAVLLILRGWDKQRQLLTAVAFSGLILALLGISQVLFNIDWVIQVSAPAATLGNKNMFGQFILMTMPLMFFLFLTSADDERAKMWIYALATALMLIALAYVQSKAALAALAAEVTLAALLLLYLRFRHNYKPLASWRKKIALVAIVLIPLGMSQLAADASGESKPEETADAKAEADSDLSRYAGLDEEAPVSETLWNSLQQDAREQEAVAAELRQARQAITDSLLVRVSELLFGATDSGNVRLTIWLNSYYMWRDYWLLGVGIGNWTNFYSTYQSAYKQETQARGNIFHPHAHNDYLEILCELGLIGFGLFAWLLLGVCRLAWRAITSFESAKPERATLMLGPVLALVGIAVSAVFSFPFKQPMTILLVCVYLGVLSLHYANARGGLAHVFAIPNRPLKMAVAFIATAATVALTTLHYSWYMSEKHYRLGAYYYQTDKFKEAEREAYKSLNFNSISPLPKWMLSTTLISLGRYAEAVKISDEVLAENPYLSNIVRAKIYSLKRLHRLRDAARVVGELSKVDSRPKLLLQRATLLEDAGLFKEAAEAYTALRDRTLVALALCGEGERGRPKCENIAKRLRRIDRWTSRMQEKSAAKDAAARTE